MKSLEVRIFNLGQFTNFFFSNSLSKSVKAKLDIQRNFPLYTTDSTNPPVTITHPGLEVDVPKLEPFFQHEIVEFRIVNSIAAKIKTVEIVALYKVLK